MTPIIHIPRTLRPWDAVYLLAQETDPRSWILVGGLMVQAHARMKGMTDFRPTLDADFLVDILADHLATGHIVRTLERHGYQLVTGTLSGYANRMTKPDGENIDLLAADHLPQWVERKHLTRIQGSRMFTAPGGAQACERCMTVLLQDDDGATRPIRIPDQLGALMFKAAAWQADSGEGRYRHLTDAMILCALMDDPETQRRRLHSRNDFTRIRLLCDAILDEGQYLDTLPQADMELAKDTILTLTDR